MDIAEQVLTTETFLSRISVSSGPVFASSPGSLLPVAVVLLSLQPFGPWFCSLAICF